MFCASASRSSSGSADSDNTPFFCSVRRTESACEHWASRGLQARQPVSRVRAPRIAPAFFYRAQRMRSGSEPFAGKLGLKAGLQAKFPSSL